MKKYLMALDAGTTSNRCIIYDENFEIVSMHSKKFSLIYLKDSYVEQNPKELFDTMLWCMKECINDLGEDAKYILGLGITNQRETTIIWDKKTGEPIYNAIVWQCRRTINICEDLKKLNLSSMIKEKTGLVIDPYFSATKIKWIFDNVDFSYEKADNGDLLFGTVDTWIIYNLTKGKLHITDYTNAQRTMLFNINTLTWDDEILNILNINKKILPTVKNSAEIYGEVDREFFNLPIKICACIGDQQSSLFGHSCFEKGDIKCTYGTGGFLLMNIGDKPILSKNGLLTTIAYGINGEIKYALEGSTYICASALHWLKDIGLIEKSEDADKLVASIKEDDDCMVVPAFTGLGSPYWEPYARGTIVGITKQTKKEHIVKATLESIAFQINDVIKVMEIDTNIKLNAIKVDGGVSNSNVVMQMQADYSNINIVRPKNVETTSMGSIYLAGIALGIYTKNNLKINNNKIDKIFNSNINDEYRKLKLKKWENAIKTSIFYAKNNYNVK